jgi:hypothetical protein
VIKVYIWKVIYCLDSPVPEEFLISTKEVTSEGLYPVIKQKFGESFQRIKVKQITLIRKVYV